MTVSTRPAAIARGSSERLVSAAEIVKTKYNARAWQWFSNFLLKAFINRVNCLMLIRMVGLCLPASAGPTFTYSDYFERVLWLSQFHRAFHNLKHRFEV